MDFFINIVNTFEFSALCKILLITILSGIIGLEREAWNKPAGFKTHTLVGISATLVMICGEYLSNTLNSDPSRIAAQLLSGIGFIGAGTILRDGFNVKGLTTAASLLTVTCIGLSVGAGFYLGAIVTTVLVCIILLYYKVITDKIDKYNVIKLHIELAEKTNIMHKLEDIFNKYQIIIDDLKFDSNDKKNMDLIAKYKEKVDKNALILNISSLETVLSIREIKS